MEHRDDGLIVDYSGYRKLEQETQNLDQETRLFRAMNEIRQYNPKSMNPQQRQLFVVVCEKIFAKHGVNAETYAQTFGNLGTPQNLHR